MYKIISISVLIGFIFFSPRAHAELTTVPETCPNMNGHFQHKQLGATADAYITQTACDSMHVLIDANVLGTAYTEDVQSPLDGVTRPAPPTNANETDTISGKWVGDTATFIIDRYIKDSNGSVKHTTNQVTGTLTTINNLRVENSDVDAQGNLSNTKGYDFKRIP